MTRLEGCDSLAARRTLRPSALGSRMSVMTQSNASVLRDSMACSPSGTTVTVWPAPRRASPRVTAMVRSSSASRIFIEHVAKDVPPGAGAGYGAARAPHHIQPGGVFQQFEDLVVQDVERARLDGAAVLEEVVGVALLLAGDGREDHHGELLREAFRHGQSAGLRDDQIALSHELVDVGDEAVDGRAVPGDLLELLAHGLVLPR